MINFNHFWETISFLAIGTISIRGCFIFLSSKISISPRTREIFTYIPAAILPALLMPMVFFHKGNNEILQGKERFIVLIFAIFICIKTKNMLLTVFFGLGLLFLINHI